MLKRLRGKEEVPQWLSNKLTGMMFGATTSLMIYVGGLVIVGLIFWWRCQDVWIAAAAVTGILLSLYRVAVFSLFKRRNREIDCARSNTRWTLLYSIGGWCFSLDVAALLARAIFVGEMLSIVLALIVVSGYLMGVIMRAARPLFAVPSLLLLFVPLIAVAACAPDKGYLAVALLLALFCVACVEFVLKFERGIKAQLLAEHQPSLLARMDHLTGLANRGGLVEHGLLLLEKAESSRCSYALALIDLDGFKSVNDTYGHGAGDELLKDVSIRIKAILGGRHFAARLGGDEFAIVFDLDTELDDAIALGNQIVSGLSHPFDSGGAKLQISASVGIARLEGPEDTYASIMERADRALYQAKNAGRNQAQVLVAPEFSPSIVPTAIGASADVVLTATMIVTA
jgi:diguanylate cyclase (GGDEF)-like protein